MILRFSRSGHTLKHHASAGEVHGYCNSLDLCIWRGAGFKSVEGIREAWLKAHGWKETH